MDRTGAVFRGKPGRDGGDPSLQLLLPSRAAVLASLMSALEPSSGPVLLTGETGVGKTWLSRRLRAQMPQPWRWAAVDLTPSLGPAGLYRFVLRGLGLTLNDIGELAGARVAVADALAEASADGQRWGLIIDEAQNGSEAVLEEVRVLGNGLGDSESFAGILLVGQTGLVARLARRPLSALGARVASRAHLRALEIEELRLFLAHFGSLRESEVAAIEMIHRVGGGNPRQACRLVGESLARPNFSPVRVARTRNKPPDHRSDDQAHSHSPDIPRPDLSRAIPSRPPLRFEEGVVEVGWDGSPDFEESVAPGNRVSAEIFTSSALDDDLPQGPRSSYSSQEDEKRASLSEEMIHDRYAALQAWNELEENLVRGRPRSNAESPIAPPSSVQKKGDEFGDLEQEDHLESGLRLPLVGKTDVRVENQHGFAPYSQLFSRLRQTREAP